MKNVELPADLFAKLQAAGYPAKLCDESGEPKMVAMPIDIYQQMFDVWANSVFGPASLERARQEPGDVGTEEAVAYVRKLASEYRKS